MIKIYCKSVSSLDEDILNNSNMIREIFSKYQSKKILGFNNRKEAKLRLCSAFNIKRGLCDLGYDEKITGYKENSNGKPYFSNIENVFFSVSHSENLAVCAFSDKEIGIDCELSERTINNNVLKRFFSETEYKNYKDFPLLLWTAKEALTKLSGEGIIIGAKKTPVPFFKEEINLNGTFLHRYNINSYTVCTASKTNEKAEIIFTE